jgi:hypothetical protein
VFGKVIAEVGFAGGPKNNEVALLYAVADPVKLHVDGA